MATLLGAALNFGLQTMLARLLGLKQFGVFASSLATVMLVAPLAGFGLAGFWLRVYGQEGQDAQRWLAVSLRFILISTSLVVLGLLTWAWIGPHDELTASLIKILSITILGNIVIELGSARFQIENNYIGLALWQILLQTLRLSSIAVLVQVFGIESIDALSIAVIFSGVACVMLMIGIFQLASIVYGKNIIDGHISKVDIKVNDKSLLSSPTICNLTYGTLPFGLAGFFYLIYYQSDIVMLKYIVGDSEAALYNVAFVVISSVYIFPTVLYQKFLLPKLHRWAYQDLINAARVYRISNLSMLFLGIASMILLWWLTPMLLPWIFGDDYLDAIWLVLILSLAVPFRFISSVSGAILSTNDLIWSKLKIILLATLFNLVFNLILIPHLGAIGAAISTVCTEVLLCILFYLSVGKILRLTHLKDIVTMKDFSNE